MKKSFHSKHELTPLAVSAFCSQLAMLLRGGVSAHESLLLLSDGTANEEEARLFSQLANEVGNGSQLYEALAKSGHFPSYTIEMVRIGESAGRLEDVLDALNNYYIRNERLKQTVRSAVVHPLIMLCLLVALVAVLLVRVLPVFAQVYAQLGAEMSPFATRLMIFGSWLGRGSLVIGASLIMIASLLFLLWKSQKGHTAILRLLSGVPLLRGLMRQITTSRFSYSMALMLKSGMPFEQAIDMAMPLFSGDAKERIQGLLTSLGSDEPYHKAFTQSGLFDSVDARLLQVGARIGEIDIAMEILAKRSEAQSDAQFSKLVGFIEPVMVALMSLVAGMVLLSVMMPLLGIMAAI